MLVVVGVGFGLPALELLELELELEEDVVSGNEGPAGSLTTPFSIQSSSNGHPSLIE